MLLVFRTRGYAKFDGLSVLLCKFIYFGIVLIVDRIASASFAGSSRAFCYFSVGRSGSRPNESYIKYDTAHVQNVQHRSVPEF